MMLLMLALITVGFPVDDDSWEMYWIFYKEDDEPHTIVTLSNLTWT